MTAQLLSFISGVRGSLLGVYGLWEEEIAIVERLLRAQERWRDE